MQFVASNHPLISFKLFSTIFWGCQNTTRQSGLKQGHKKSYPTLVWRQCSETLVSYQCYEYCEYELIGKLSCSENGKSNWKKKQRSWKTIQRVSRVHNKYTTRTTDIVLVSSPLVFACWMSTMEALKLCVKSVQS